jgi:class 3 adenylate cyclase
MKVIKQEGDRVTVEMGKHEYVDLVKMLIDVDDSGFILEDRELGDLSDYINEYIKEMSQLMN